MSLSTEFKAVPTGPPLRNMIRVVGLVALAVGVSTQIQNAHSTTPRALSVVLLIVSIAAWVGWLIFSDRGSRPGVAICLIVLAGAGGTLAPTATTAIGFAAVVGVGAAMAFELPFAVVIAAISPAAHLISAAVHGVSYVPVLGSAAAALGGVILGIARRQAQTATEQAALMQVERARTEVEHDRAELLAERNRLAREIHDVLAHTLGAVSVQLEALDAVVDHADTGQVHDRVQATRGLVVQGLDEARRAVTALRDDAPPLPQQLKELCSNAGAELELDGDQPPLSPPATLALFRIAQEALTNAAKHAPGAPVGVTLHARVGVVVLEVTNARPTGAPGLLAAQGGGYGLQGMRERVLLLGGTLDAGPSGGGGWRVRASLPI